MNFVPIVSVRPVCLHLHFSTFSRLSRRKILVFRPPGQSWLVSALLTGVQIKPRKEPLLAYAAVDVDEYMVKKLYYISIQIRAPFIC